MLLRTASTPILNPWKPHFKQSSPDIEIVHQFPKSRPLTLCVSFKLLPPPPMIGRPAIKMMRTLSESDLSNLSVVVKRTPRMGLCCGVDEVGESSDCGGEMVGAFVDGGVTGDGHDGDNGCFGSWDSDSENDKADLYYQRMIEAHTENSLLLSNYAQFLKEVHDMKIEIPSSLICFKFFTLHLVLFVMLRLVSEEILVREGNGNLVISNRSSCKILF